jgi:uncharacterized protein YdeI (YjbR/CyaY-like superfamily)
MHFRATLILNGKTATGIQVPDDPAAALDTQPEAKATFEKLSYSNQRLHVLSVEDAKTPETRQRRMDKVLATLGAGK